MRSKDPLKANQIRSQALEMLVQEGFDGFSMQKLARASKVSPATLYIHFEDRDDLLFQLYKEQMAVFTAILMDGFDPHGTFAKGLETQWRNRMRFCREHPISWKFLDQVLYSHYQPQFVHRIETPFFQAMHDFMKGAVERGEIRDLGADDHSGQFPTQLFWALAYAPLYELLRMEGGHGPGGHCRSVPFELTPERFDLALRQVLRSLQP